MNGAPFGSLLVFPALLTIAVTLLIGMGIGSALTKPAVQAEPPCIVIDMRTKPGAGRLVPAEPSGA